MGCIVGFWTGPFRRRRPGRGRSPTCALPPSLLLSNHKGGGREGGKEGGREEGGKNRGILSIEASFWERTIRGRKEYRGGKGKKRKKKRPGGGGGGEKRKQKKN
jgi:hypothetical protein